MRARIGQEGPYDGHNTICDPPIEAIPGSWLRPRRGRRDEIRRLGCLGVNLYTEGQWPIIAICVQGRRHQHRDGNVACLTDRVEVIEVVFPV